MRQLNSLEELGLEVAAMRWLGLKPGEARLLSAFLLARGRPVRLEALDRALAPHNDRWGDLRVHGRETLQGRNRVRVVLHRLKDALADIGHAGCIESVWGEGYRMPAAAAELVWAGLEASL